MVAEALVAALSLNGGPAANGKAHENGTGAKLAPEDELDYGSVQRWPAMEVHTYGVNMLGCDDGGLPFPACAEQP